MEAIHQECACCGRFLGWFEHHGIAGDQRGNNVPVRQVGREVIGTEDSQHPVRLAARAAATSVAALPAGADQSSAPVAGSVETIMSVIQSPARLLGGSDAALVRSTRRV